MLSQHRNPLIADSDAQIPKARPLCGPARSPRRFRKVAPAYVYVRVDDVEAAAARVEDAGGRPLSRVASRSWGEDAAWFADPDGNVIAVAQSSAQVVA